MEEKIKKRFFVLVLITVVIAVLSGSFVLVNAISYNAEDIVSFGLYPQTKVTDEDLIKQLDKQSLSWKSYGYYSGNDIDGDGEGDVGTMVQGDYMKYADFTYSFQKFRAVKFTEYRPFRPFNITSSTATNNFQKQNGYNVNTVYYFKYEPLKWRIIDNQPFNNTVYEYGADDYYFFAFWSDESYKFYANNYEKSSLRQWLNNDFYNLSFNDDEKASLLTREIDNSAYSKEREEYSSNNTFDKVSLLSYKDANNKRYGFTSIEKLAANGTDYAKCQGLRVYEFNMNSNYRLTTASFNSLQNCAVTCEGYVAHTTKDDKSFDGIRPLIQISDYKNVNR